MHYKLQQTVLTLATVLIAFANPSGAAALAISEQPEAKQVPSNEIKVSADQINEFALRLLRDKLREQTGKQNTLISPVGLLPIMGALVEGTDGETQRELLSALSTDQPFSEPDNSALFRFSTAPVPGATTRFSTALCATDNTAISQSFKQRLLRSYSTELIGGKSTNEVSQNLSNWVSMKTNGQVKSAPGTITDESLCIASTLYFNSKWFDQFKAEQTKDAPFHISAKSTITVKMMEKIFQTGPVYYETDEFQMVGLPYESVSQMSASPYAMYVFLPKSGYDAGDIVKDLSARKLESLITSAGRRNGQLRLPRFDIDCDYDLNDSFQSAGIKRIFTESAQLKPTGANVVKLSDVRQRLRMLVNEKGTELSVLTTAIEFLGPISDPFFMTVDRPFLALIRDQRTGMLLLIGLISRPIEDLNLVARAEHELYAKLKSDEEQYLQHSGDPNGNQKWEYERHLSTAVDYLSSQHKYAQALPLCKKLIALAPDSTSVEFKLAQIQSHSNHRNDALQTYQSLMKQCEKILMSRRGYFDSEFWKDVWQQYREFSPAKNTFDTTAFLNECALRKDVSGKASSKESFEGSWRRDITSVNLPDAERPLNYELFFARMDTALLALAKDNKQLQAIIDRKGNPAEWSTSSLTNHHPIGLGEAELELAKLYHGDNRSQGLLQRAILNIMEDGSDNMLIESIGHLVEILKKQGKVRELNELTRRSEAVLSASSQNSRLRNKLSELMQVRNNESDETRD